MAADPRVALKVAVDAKPFRRAVLSRKVVHRLWRPSTVRGDVASVKAETPIFWAVFVEHHPTMSSGATRFLQATEPNISYDRPGYTAEYQGGDPVPVAYLEEPGPRYP